jgi:hypothetical protein
VRGTEAIPIADPTTDPDEAFHVSIDECKIRLLAVTGWLMMALSTGANVATMEERVDVCSKAHV